MLRYIPRPLAKIAKHRRGGNGVTPARRFRVLNLFDPFWQRRADGLYLGGFDEHWNPRGEAYAAELMAEFLRAQNLLGALSR